MNGSRAAVPGLERYQTLDPWDESWVDFATTHPDANIFHHPEWIRLLADCYGFRPFALVLFDYDSKIQAGLPMMEVQSWITGRRWVSLPFTDFCAPLYQDRDCLDRLAHDLGLLSKENHIPRIEVRWELPGQPPDQTGCNYVLHNLNICDDLEQTFKQFHRTQRQNVHTAEKHGIEIRWGKNLEHMREFYTLHCLTRRRQGMPVQPWRFFELIFSNLIEKGLGFILLAAQDDQCLSGGVFLHWNRTLTYKYSASNDECQNLRPNHLLTWTAIRWGCEHGFSIFDFGRSDVNDEGLRTYKKRWGAEEVPLNYSTFPANTNTPSSSRLMAVMNKVIQRNPVWVSRLAGEVLYKHFG